MTRHHDPIAERTRLEALHQYEREAWAQGFSFVAGVDEVGRGPLAGPVVAAAVVLDRPLLLPYLNDSKRLTASRRTLLAAQIRETVVDWAIAEIGNEEIDRCGIGIAVRVAMERALAALQYRPDTLLVDGTQSIAFTGVQRTIIGGDGLCASIAAASILAKVHRDALLEEYDRLHPEYGFAQHKGYGTAAHLAALARCGATPLHRRSFAPVRVHTR